MNNSMLQSQENQTAGVDLDKHYSNPITTKKVCIAEECWFFLFM